MGRLRETSTEYGTEMGVEEQKGNRPFLYRILHTSPGEALFFDDSLTPTIEPTAVSVMAHIEAVKSFLRAAFFLFKY